jgi:hypothetical protein
MPQHHLESRDHGRSAHWRALTHAVSRTALAACLVCAATAVARAGDDDTQSSGGSLYDRFLQVIGVPGSGADINYSERSPLVVPPTRDLPPPSADAPPPVADWPKDPDVTRRAQAKVKEKPHPHADYATDLARPLRPDELNAASTGSRGEAPTPGASSNADYPEHDYVAPKKSIFDWFSTSKEEYATFTGEPTRSSLTDPPSGYMTPSADQPYGVGPDQKKYKVPTVADRATPVSGTAAQQ